MSEESEKSTMSDKSLPNLSGIGEFRLHVDRWSTYMSRLKAWFTINDIEPANQPNYLVAVIGTEALDLLIDLCYPEKPKKVTIDKLEKYLEECVAKMR